MERRNFVVGVAVSAAVAGCSTVAPDLRQGAVSAPVATDPAALDPLLAPWIGPYGGLPRFDLVKVESFKPALLHAMDLIRADIKSFTRSDAPPTFANMVEP